MPSRWTVVCARRDRAVHRRSPRRWTAPRPRPGAGGAAGTRWVGRDVRRTPASPYGSEASIAGADDEVPVGGQCRVGIHGGADVEVEQCRPSGVEAEDMAGLGGEVQPVAVVKDSRTPNLSRGAAVAGGLRSVAH